MAGRGTPLRGAVKSQCGPPILNTTLWEYDMNEHTIDSIKADLNSLSARLKELEDKAPPKLRFGDIVRRASTGEMRIIIITETFQGSERLSSYDPSGFLQSGHADELLRDGSYVLIGNAFDMAKGL
jgi:hypothetical protein